MRKNTKRTPLLLSFFFFSDMFFIKDQIFNFLRSQNIFNTNFPFEKFKTVKPKLT